jgi:hypothetical protein
MELRRRLFVELDARSPRAAPSAPRRDVDGLPAASPADSVNTPERAEQEGDQQNSTNPAGPTRFSEEA